MAGFATEHGKKTSRFYCKDKYFYNICNICNEKQNVLTLQWKKLQEYSLQAMLLLLFFALKDIE